MMDIVRSKPALVLVALASFAVAVSHVLGGLAFLGIERLGMSAVAYNLISISTWVFFAANIVVLLAVCVVLLAARGVLHRRSAQSSDSALDYSWEMAAVALTTLCYVAGVFVSTISPVTPYGDGVSAVGISGWAVIIAVKAVHAHRQEQEHPAPVKQSSLWLLASMALLALAVGWGMNSIGGLLTVFSVVVTTAGFAGLAIALAVSRRQGLIVSDRISMVVTSLWGLTVSYMGLAVANGLLKGPQESLVIMKVGFAVSIFIGAIAWAIMSVAAIKESMS